MNFASQLMQAATAQRAFHAEAYARMTIPQREAYNRRKRVSEAVTSKPATPEEIAKSIGESINYVQKALTAFEDEWGLSKHRTANNVPYKWWIE